MMHELDVSSTDARKNNPDELEVLFKEMIQMCLWHVLVLTTTFSGTPILLFCYQGKCHGLYFSGINYIS